MIDRLNSSGIQPIVSRLGAHERLLSYVVDSYLRGEHERVVDQRTAEVIHRLLRQLSRDIATVKEVVGAR